MKKIRTGVFETNSSSMHSICIASNKDNNRYSPSDIIKTVYVGSDGFVYVYDEDLSFGRYPFRILFDLYDKTMYAIASFGKEKLEEITQIFKTAYNEAVDELNSQSEHQSVQYRYFEGFEMPRKYDEDDECGYIDHQSFGMLQNYLSKNKITLEEFLLNPKCVIVIDGDEYMNLDRYQDAGFLTELKVVW